MRKWYNFETRFITLRDAMRDYLNGNSIKFEVSGNGSYYHFEIYANNAEVEAINNWIDNNSIDRDSSGFFAYFKMTFSDAGRNGVMEMRRSNGLSISGYNNLSKQISFLYFKNSGGIKYFSLVGYVDYNKNGKILYSWSTNNFDWDRIIPDTYNEMMYDAAWARVSGK